MADCGQWLQVSLEINDKILTLQDRLGELRTQFRQAITRDELEAVKLTAQALHVDWFALRGQINKLKADATAAGCLDVAASAETIYQQAVTGYHDTRNIEYAAVDKLNALPPATPQTETPADTGSGKDDGSQNTDTAAAAATAADAAADNPDEGSTPSGNADGSQNPDAGTPPGTGEEQNTKTQPEDLDEVVVTGHLYEDWRVRLALAPGSNYLYNDESNTLLAPLKYTNGVIFPYTPAVNVTYGASYAATQPVHSNYKIFQYEGSNVDSISITCDFTAQDTYEANYLLAVIHFFKAATKMFYGQDNNPKPGTPPPMCFLHGMGQFQFKNSPLAITNFTYSLPQDVDYIRASGKVTRDATSGDSANLDVKSGGGGGGGGGLKNRLIQNTVMGMGSVAGGFLGDKLKLAPGGILDTTYNFTAITANSVNEATYVPTKIQLQISAVPIISRYDISNNFSLKDYANGNLIKRGFIW